MSLNLAVILEESTKKHPDTFAYYYEDGDGAVYVALEGPIEVDAYTPSQADAFKKTATQRALPLVGQSNLKGTDGILGTVVHVVRSEGRLNERREVLDVRAENDDVAGLQGRIVLQHVQDGVAQYFDLPAAAVTGVNSDAVVLSLQERPFFHVLEPMGGAVSPDIVLDPPEERLACREFGIALDLAGLRASEDKLHLASVATP